MHRWLDQVGSHVTLDHFTHKCINVKPVLPHRKELREGLQSQIGEINKKKKSMCDVDELHRALQEDRKAKMTDENEEKKKYDFLKKFKNDNKTVSSTSNTILNSLSLLYVCVCVCVPVCLHNIYVHSAVDGDEG